MPEAAALRLSSLSDAKPDDEDATTKLVVSTMMKSSEMEKSRMLVVAMIII